MAKSTPAYWLLKSEPDAFSIDDLERRPRQTEMWDGVRNYQARNLIRDAMKPGDLAFFYHSSCAQPGIVGVAQIASAGYPDPTQFDAAHAHYDPGSKRDDPRWYAIDVRLDRKLHRLLALDELRSHAGTGLKDLRLLARGNRLSVMPVSPQHWRFILGLE